MDGCLGDIVKAGAAIRQLPANNGIASRKNAHHEGAIRLLR
jgi:hypothetical protein